ncbi:hypothetical protein [Nostoc sp. ChiQUE01b]|nr:hypothetical protein [Nostoc sp. ChiQUE01b]MDZ8262453.1 hypothetical protein [Nostoc sp. ChiQUE01b]
MTISLNNNDTISKGDRLLNWRCWDGCLDRFEYITALYRWRQQ